MSKFRNKVPAKKKYNTLFENSATDIASNKKYFKTHIPNLSEIKNGNFTPYKKIPAIGERFKMQTSLEHYNSDSEVAKEKVNTSKIPIHQRQFKHVAKLKVDSDIHSIPHRKMLRRKTYIVLEPIVLGKIVKIDVNRDKDTTNVKSDTDKKSLFENSLLFGSKIFDNEYSIDRDKIIVKRHSEKTAELNNLSQLVNNLKLTRKSDSSHLLRKDKWLFT